MQSLQRAADLYGVVLMAGTPITVDCDADVSDRAFIPDPASLRR
jgi:hypothetical protein